MRHRLTAGIDLGGTNIRVAVIDENGSVKRRATARTPNEGGPTRIIDCLADLLNTVTQTPGMEPLHLQGVGIGMPGPLNTERGIVSFMPNIRGFSNFPFKKAFQDRTGFDVTILNDADAAAIGEYRCGAAQHKQLFVMLTLGTGLGSSLMIDGHPWLGTDGFSSELGHIAIFDRNDVCACGKRGHSETRLSVQGLFQGYASQRGTGSAEKPFSVHSLFKTAEEGDSTAGSIVRRYGEALGRVISVASVALNIRDFVIGGGISGGWSLLKNAVFQAIDEFGFAPLTQNIDICLSHLGNDAAVVGAGLYVLNGNAKTVNY